MFISSFSSKKLKLSQFVLLNTLAMIMISDFVTGNTPPRSREAFNADWRFIKNDPPGVDDRLQYGRVKQWILPGAEAL
jgi:hypothetical protein